jgi:hypothetical protein
MPPKHGAPSFVPGLGTSAAAVPPMSSGARGSSSRPALRTSPRIVVAAQLPGNKAKGVKECKFRVAIKVSACMGTCMLACMAACMHVRMAICMAARARQSYSRHLQIGGNTTFVWVTNPNWRHVPNDLFTAGGLNVAALELPTDLVGSDGVAAGDALATAKFVDCDMVFKKSQVWRLWWGGTWC